MAVFNPKRIDLNSPFRYIHEFTVRVQWFSYYLTKMQNDDDPKKPFNILQLHIIVLLGTLRQKYESLTKNLKLELY